MKKKLILLGLVLGSYLLAQVDTNESELAVYLDEKKAKTPADTQFYLDRYKGDLSTEIKDYRKVTLMDVVLETVSNSDLLKASRELVIQSELKLKDAMSGYYPTLNFESEVGRTRGTEYDSQTGKGYKYFNERNYKLVLNQNLYAGGETANMVKNFQKKLNVEKKQYEIMLQEQITKAIKAYFDVVFSYRTVMASESNMSKLNRIMEIIDIKYENGAASIGDLTAIKANVSNAQTQLTKVKSKLTEAIRYYEYVVGDRYLRTLPFEKNFSVDVSTFDLLYERAINQNSIITNYYELIDSEKFHLAQRKSGFAPRVDFEASWDNIEDKEDFKGREEVYNAQLRLTMNLYNGGKDKNKVLTSYSTIRELNFKLNEEKKKLKWNISRLFTSIQSTNEALKSNIAEIISLRKMVDAYWEEFNLGQQDLQSLLQGYKQLNSAETELIKNEYNNVTDFFTLLGYTGDLMAFFDLDPIHPKFINFANSNYVQDIYMDEKFLNEKEKIEREASKKKDEEFKILLANEAIKDINISGFTSKFLSSSDEFFTIEIGNFKNQKEALEYIKKNNFDKDALTYDVISNFVVTSRVAYGIFENIVLAKAAKNRFLKNSSENAVIKIKTLKNAKQHYTDYINGLKVDNVKKEVKVIEKINTIEKIKQEKKEPEFKFDETIMNKFMSAKDGDYTIHITSFNNKKDLENILNANANIYSNSYGYFYSNTKTLLRWNYGVYSSYEEALKAMQSLDEVAKFYYPVIQKISQEKELYKSYVPIKEQVKDPEYEYIDVSSTVEYKEGATITEDSEKEDSQ